jgi:hypothetical protein
MATVLKAFGSLGEIAAHVGPDWAAVPQPDLFDQATPSDAVAHLIEYRIYMAGQDYWTNAHAPSVAETRELLELLKARFVAVSRTMQRLSHARELFNTIRSDELTNDGGMHIPTLGWNLPDALEDFLRLDPWQRVVDIINDAHSRLMELIWYDGLAKRFKQPATRRRNPERALWEAILALLQECGVSPSNKYQDLIETIRALHRVFNIEPPNPSNVQFVAYEFRKRPVATNKKAAR